MGLDVVAYKNIKLDLGKKENRYELFVNIGFPQSNMPHIEKECEDIVCSESLDVWSSSYSGYNNFRNDLCKLANNISAEELWESKDENLKFYWLINFSDCEGYIGTSYCKILYNDFARFREEISQKVKNEYFMKKYDFWLDGFRLAKDNGLISFR